MKNTILDSRDLAGSSVLFCFSAFRGFWFGCPVHKLAWPSFLAIEEVCSPSSLL